jgi:hypothetical protein
MAKWLSLIVALIAGGVLAYKLFLAPPPAGTPHATADAFVKAATAGDREKIRSLCAQGAADSALEVADRLRPLSPSLTSLSFQRMKVQPPAEDGVTALVSGRILGFEMARSGKDWKILKVELAE